MSGERELPWYEEIGREPWPDDKVEAAIAAWSDDHPGQIKGAIAGWMRGLNKAARKRATAAALGVSERALDQAEAEKRAAKREHLWRQDLEAARRAVGIASNDDRPIDRLRRALREWAGEWPPTQGAIAEAVGWKTSRSVHQARANATPATTWPAELAAAKDERGIDGIPPSYLAM